MNIWPWNRISELERANANLQGRLQRWEDYWKQFEQLKAQNKVTNLAVARIIAKIDPEYVRSEFDPDRRKESDEINDKIMRKLLSEHLASNPTRTAL